MEVKGEGGFRPTRWTLVQRVQGDGSEIEAKEALNELCGMYWRPLYAFARGFGRSAEDAEDVVQGFLTRGVEKEIFAAADREKGKMRTFLLVSFKRYLRDVHAKDVAVKRGEGKVDTMDIAAEEARWEDSEAVDPTLSFDKRWALIVVESAREQGVSLSSVKVGVHRMRKRFGEMLRAEIVETVGEGEDVDEELRYLIEVLG